MAFVAAEKNRRLKKIVRAFFKARISFGSLTLCGWSLLHLHDYYKEPR